MKNLLRNTVLNIRAKAPNNYYISPPDKSGGYFMHVCIIMMKHK